MTLFQTKYNTTGFLSDGSGTAPRPIEVPALTSCKPAGDGSFFAEGWRQWGGPDLAKGSFGDHDVTYRGICIQGCHVEEIKP